MKYDYHIIVIGAGSGGLVVASGAASLGAKVALIEGEKMGGDCLNFGCVPSKTFLRSAHLAADIRKSSQLGIGASLDTTDVKDVMQRVRDVIAEIEPHDSVERYEGLGVTVLQGMATFVGPHEVRVNGKVITAKNIVIATGSRAAIPPIPGLDTVPYLTNKTVFELQDNPKHLIVLGAGPIGLELGQGFCHLGSEVSVIDMAPELFMKDDAEVGPMMTDVFLKDGMQLHLGSEIIDVKGTVGEITVVIEKDGQQQEIRGDQLLLALGRVPNSDGLGLDHLGISTDGRGFIKTNASLQTNHKHIFACGDVTGPFLFTHMAGYQAGLVLRNIVFRWLPAKLDYSKVPWTTYTKPEVSHVGYTEDWAKKEGLYVDHLMVNLNDMDRAKTEHDRVGFLKLILGKKGRIIGATMVGDKAGEIMPLATMAIRTQQKASTFMSMTFSYPVEAEIFKFASFAYAKKTFKPWMKAIIGKFL